MLIRPATPADIPVIRVLEQESDTAAHWSDREYDALFAPEAPKRIALTVSEDARICGFAIARCGPDDWEIENVVVASDQRRSGIGTGLIGEILRSAREAGAAAVLLEVRESNSAACHLYEKAGFVEMGRRKLYYHDPPEDALVLRFSGEKL